MVCLALAKSSQVEIVSALRITVQTKRTLRDVVLHDKLVSEERLAEAFASPDPPYETSRSWCCVNITRQAKAIFGPLLFFMRGQRGQNPGD